MDEANPDSEKFYEQNKLPNPSSNKVIFARILIGADKLFKYYIFWGKFESRLRWDNAIDEFL